MMLDETSLRPLRLSDFAGQPNLKEQLQIYIDSAKARNDAIEHILLSGPPGLGKTSLASIIANEMNSRIIITSGVTLKSIKDVVEILLHLKKGDILFIDEIHRLHNAVEELLYPVMEDFRLDGFFEDNTGKRPFQVNFDRFTLIGATTRAGLLSAPLRDRFGIMMTFELYTVDELAKVVGRSAGILGVVVDTGGIMEISKRAHGTPRIANSFLRRVRDFAIARNGGVVTKEIAAQALTTIGIDEMGLGKVDIKILKILAGSKKPVGLKTIASLTGEDIRTIEEVYEPYLMRIGFMNIEKNGRQITSEGLNHLGLKEKEEKKSEKKEEKNNTKMDEETACAILGIPTNATNEQIKKAYRFFASIWHPDIGVVHDDSRMKQINLAYEYLKNKRQFT